MSKEEIFNYFFTNSANFGVKEIALTMLAGLLVSIIIYVTYWLTNNGVQYNSKFNISLIIVSLISILIMLMISSNIVISLGMVGALSIVRFRTAIKDSRDTVFIFWAIAEGLCTGSSNLKLAIITTLFIAMVFIVTSYIPRIWNKYLIVIRGEKTIKSSEIIEELKQYVKNYKIRAANKNENQQEIIIEVRVKGELNSEIIEKVSKVKNVKSINYVIESGETVG